MCNYEFDFSFFSKSELVCNHRIPFLLVLFIIRLRLVNFNNLVLLFVACALINIYMLIMLHERSSV